MLTTTCFMLSSIVLCSLCSGRHCSEFYFLLYIFKCHVSVYFIVFVCRQGKEEAQRVLFQKSKFASFLIENFVPYSVGSTKEAVKAATNPSDKDLVARRIACRGLIMNCANAIRLQVNSNTEDTPAYLKNFFEAHPTWKAFQPKLTVCFLFFFFCCCCCCCSIFSFITQLFFLW